MAKMKLTLARLPDFPLPVVVTLPNGDEAHMTFKVKHVSATEFQELYSAERVVSDHELIMNLASGWNLEDEFNEENAKKLVSFYPNAALVLASSYLKALAGQRVKN